MQESLPRKIKISDLKKGSQPRFDASASVEILINDRLPPTSEEINQLTRIASLPEVEQVVALPDLHIKPQLEAPSSIASATAEHLILGLSSPSPNCAMALASTPLGLNDISETMLDTFFAEIALKLPLKRAEPIITEAQMKEVLRFGASALTEHYGLSADALNYMEQNGNAIPAEKADWEAIAVAVPQLVQDLGRRDFGQIGKGNHFLELQVIEKIEDEAVAQAWGLKKGQVMLMYHADSGRLGGFIGRLYAHRRKNTRRGRMIELQVKVPFQLKTGKASRVPRRLGYHLWPRRFTPLPAESAEGAQAWLALQAGSNYAYANRLAIFSVLNEALKSVWGEAGAGAKLLWDAPHNSIRPEKINGQMRWIHRHNAAKITPPTEITSESPFAGTGHPVLLPGTNQTSSYLCVSDEGAAQTLHSADHGAGRSAMRLGQPLNNGVSTRVYDYSGQMAPEPHLSDTGLNAVLSVLQTYNIARPVARLRPLAGLKAKK